MTALRKLGAIAGLAFLSLAPGARAADRELLLTMRNDPKTFDPLLVEEDASETIRYLTGGVLVRVNRLTRKAEPELAESWSLTDGGRTMRIKLRPGLRFSDGTPLTAADVAFTFRRMMDPAITSGPTDGFRSAAKSAKPTVNGPDSVTVAFGAPVAGLELLLDQIPIQPSTGRERVAAGPFRVAEYRPGVFVLLRRNPHYWKRKNGRQLPSVDAIRFAIQPTRELEAARLKRGELHMVDNLEPELFERLRGDPALKTVDAGATTDIEMLWFNQSPNAPIPEFKKAWFRSAEFRRAISMAINRPDLARLAYRGYAQPASGPLPPNSAWFNGKIQPTAHDVAAARKLLSQAGFRTSGQKLLDPKGNAVAFSIVTSASSKARTRLAALIQDDLAKLGVRVAVVPLEFRSLLERIGKTMEYETCLLGLWNLDDDPSALMNVLLSSGAQHMWNPSQASPATVWEAQIDRFMVAQSSTADARARKRAFDAVQQILSDKNPILFLVHPHALTAYSASLKGVTPVPVRPHLFWNIEEASF